MSQKDASQGPFDQLLSVLDRLPFVASLKKDAALLRNLVVRRRVPRIACVGALEAGRDILGQALFARAAAGETAVPTGDLSAGFRRGEWVRISTSWGRVDWVEFDTLDSPDASEQRASEPPKGQTSTLARPLQTPDVLVAVLAHPPGGPKADAFVREVSRLRQAWTAVPEGREEADSTGTSQKTSEVPLVVVVAGEAPAAAAVLKRQRGELEQVLSDAGSRPHAVIAVDHVGAKPTESSLASLSEALLEVLPEATRLEAARALLFARKGRKKVASQVVQSCATLALTVGLAPVPLSDVAVILPLQLMMVSVVAYLGGRELDRAAALEWVASLGVVGGAGLGLRWTAQQLLKLVPGAGTVVSGSVAGAGTVALGQSAMAYFLDASKR